MNKPPLIPLDYRGPKDPEPANPNANKQFAWGLFGGIGVSAIAYFGGGAINPVSILILGGFIAFAKFVTSLACTLMRRYRGFGLGLLTSLPIGFMIFFAACATYVK